MLNTGAGNDDVDIDSEVDSDITVTTGDGLDEVTDTNSTRQPRESHEDH